MFVNRHLAAVRVLPVRFRVLTHQVPLISVSIRIYSNNNLAPLTRPFSLRLPPRLFNFHHAFTTKRLNPRAQHAQLLFVPTHDLFAPYADCVCGASCFFALASCLDLVGRVLYAIPGCSRCANASGRGRDYVA
jgi:hypothetical protein